MSEYTATWAGAEMQLSKAMSQMREGRVIDAHVELEHLRVDMLLRHDHDIERQRLARIAAPATPATPATTRVRAAGPKLLAAMQRLVLDTEAAQPGATFPLYFREAIEAATGEPFLDDASAGD